MESNDTALENDETTQNNETVKRIVDIPITDENSALNVMVSFLILAQSKGAFTFEESAKIWECIQKFQN